jgi:hypothetical protein
MSEEAKNNLRTNPDTCLHRVLTEVVCGDYTRMLVCISCDSTLDDEWVSSFKWFYDVDRHLWQSLGNKHGSDK